MDVSPVFKSISAAVPNPVPKNSMDPFEYKYSNPEVIDRNLKLNEGSFPDKIKNNLSEKIVTVIIKETTIKNKYLSLNILFKLKITTVPIKAMIPDNPLQKIKIKNSAVNKNTFFVKFL